MITREQLKADIDDIAETHYEVMHRIIGAFKNPIHQGKTSFLAHPDNPLKGSVIFEHDIVSPIDEPWSATQ